jgi:hypothetical protein
MERVSTVVRLQPRSRRDRARVRTDRLAPTLLALAVIAALAAIVSGVSSERRAIRSLPNEQRLAVLSSTVDELRQFCSERRPAALRDHCRELASFAAQFDECRGECEALVRRQLATAPTR